MNDAPEEKNVKEEKVKETKKNEGLLAAAARAIGTVAGAVVSTVGAHEHAPAARASKAVKGKLPKKNKSRLPRRQKKAMRPKEAAI
jgi:hypothetical protein